MATKFPDYISKDLFEKSLRNGFKDSSIVINNYEITMGSSAGDNYCSDIYRAKIVYTKNGKSNNSIVLIVKAMPFVEARSPALDNLEVFNKEVKMYTDTIPKISDILDGEYMCARCFYAIKEPVQLIVFEDLKVLGYQMADRQSGIDEAHCKLVLSKLGRFHAASIVLSEMEKHHMDKYYFGFFKPNAPVADVMKAVFEKGLISCIDQVKTWPGYENIAKKMDILSENFIQKVANLCNNSPSSIKVLNHGDLWVNNFLFKYEEGKPVDVVFVDYQMSFFSSPGLDINYFLSTSPTNEVREKKVDVLIEVYYNNFSKILKNLSNQQYSLEAVKKEIRSREFYGFSSSIGITPIIMMDKEASKESSMENLIDEEASARLRNAMYGSQNYRKAMEFMLKKFDDHKVLENIW
ncbi:uncharacterized protein LOC119071237 [Bradysia coprophila]|uniref:uncharacterized protein LOC119071237 n=1 Tax=Bradysia coprophila TaxID=38358 RepID=UPI00187D8428|nr:uncharacterized protein LOC119071237 [Bradysia coprophila]XP_037031966.1 uncharacterized protein LOC119071237 [Bradysia coprophila]